MQFNNFDKSGQMKFCIDQSGLTSALPQMVYQKVSFIKHFSVDPLLRYPLLHRLESYLSDE